MSARRVRELLLAYGADPARWPPAERVAAQRVLQQWPELQALAQREAKLDAVLDEDRLAGMAVMDEAALMRCLPASQGVVPLRTIPLAGSRTMHSALGWRWAAPALAAAVSLGIGVGWWLPQSVESASTVAVTDVEDVIEYAQIDAEYEEFLP
ncbi:MAG: hypothetical protein R3F04_01500 [Lysobacteraceae bacterium]